jgi:hypothetical protein
MKLKPKTTISEHFSAIEDPRLDRTKLHQLIDIITITLCAVIGGAETWSDIELFGNCKYDWFKSFLELPNGIPSHDTGHTSVCANRSKTAGKMFFQLGEVNK